MFMFKSNFQIADAVTQDAIATDSISYEIHSTISSTFGQNVSAFLILSVEV